MVEYGFDNGCGNVVDNWGNCHGKLSGYRLLLSQYVHLLQRGDYFLWSVVNRSRVWLALSSEPNVGISVIFWA